MNKQKTKFFPAIFGLFKQTAKERMADKAPQLRAALAYYTVYSLGELRDGFSVASRLLRSFSQARNTTT